MNTMAYRWIDFGEKNEFIVTIDPHNAISTQPYRKKGVSNSQQQIYKFNSVYVSWEWQQKRAKCEYARDVGFVFNGVRFDFIRRIRQNRFSARTLACNIYKHAHKSVSHTRNFYNNFFCWFCMVSLLQLLRRQTKWSVVNRNCSIELSTFIKSNSQMTH